MKLSGKQKKLLFLFISIATIYSLLLPAINLFQPTRTVGQTATNELLILSNSVITDNLNLGWNTVLNYDYSSLSSIPNGFLGTGSNLKVSNTSVVMENGIVLNYSNPIHFARLFLGQFYPSGHSRYRINLSITKNIQSPSVYVLFGNRATLQVIYNGNKYTIYERYYNSAGAKPTDKYYTINTAYADTYVEMFSNGTVSVYDAYNPTKSISTVHHQDWPNPYPYSLLSPTLITVYSSIPDAMNITIHSVQQQIPKNLITVTANNDTMGYGFDARYRVYNGIDWLLAHNQSATYYWDYIYWNPSRGSKYNGSLRARYLDYVQNKSVELGIHYSTELNTDPKWNVTIDNETKNAATIFGLVPIIGTCLSNACNSAHWNYSYKNYGIIWREASDIPHDIEDIGSVGDFTNGTVLFWNDASQKKVFTPAYSHTVLDDSWAYEGDDIKMSNWSKIMANYTNSGISIMGYGKWYYQNALSVANITNIYFSPSNSHFNINTSGYNATTTIYYPDSKGIWFADGGTVITTIDDANETNLIINTPSNLTVKKLNAAITVSSDSITVNVSKWNIAGDYRKAWSESSANYSVTAQHAIGDFPANTSILVKRNGVDWNTYLSNSSGYITFTYLEEDPDVQFEAGLGPVSTPPNPVNLQSTTGNFWVNHTWLPGTGNVTYSYNVLHNGTWTNGTVNNYFNTSVAPHGWSNITVFAFNSGGTEEVSPGYVSENTEMPDNPITIGNISSVYNLAAGTTLSIYPASLDVDSDTPAFGTNSTSGTFYSNNGTLIWNNVVPGTYNWYINTTDGYGSTDTAAFTVIASERPVITSWGNDRTNNDALNLTVNISTPVLFNAAADQVITTWVWSNATKQDGDGTSKSNAAKNFTTAGTIPVSVYGSNSNGSTDTKTWTVTAVDTSPAPDSTEAPITLHFSSIGGSGGSGGGAAPQDMSNIESYERRDLYIGNNISTRVDFISNDLVSGFVIRGKKNYGSTEAMVNILKGNPTSVALTDVYKFFSIQVGTIKENDERTIFEPQNISFKVKRGSVNDHQKVFLSRFDPQNKQWGDYEPEPDISVSGYDKQYLYYTAEVESFSNFAIRIINQSETSDNVQEFPNIPSNYSLSGKSVDKASEKSDVKTYNFELYRILAVFVIIVLISLVIIKRKQN